MQNIISTQSTNGYSVSVLLDKTVQFCRHWATFLFFLPLKQKLAQQVFMLFRNPVHLDSEAKIRNQYGRESLQTSTNKNCCYTLVYMAGFHILADTVCSCLQARDPTKVNQAGRSCELQHNDLVSELIRKQQSNTSALISGMPLTSTAMCYHTLWE